MPANNVFCEGTIKKFLICNNDFVVNGETYCLAFELKPIDTSLPNLMFVFIPSGDIKLRNACLKIDSKLAKISIEAKKLENCNVPSYELIDIKVLSFGEANEETQIETQFIKASNYDLTSKNIGNKQHLNKGMQIWKKKRENRLKKAVEMKSGQAEICRFVNFRNTVHRKVNGKYSHSKIEHLQGLQVKNRVYYIKDNEVTYVLVNKHGAGVTKVHEGVPDWADERLVKKYNDSNIK
ncbi:MAG: hypothetical protein K2J85_06930 [Anaeroplasmataceae bacterium]|nr:hypothetical protein [Anaeroplasmataceae bacterium]